VTIIGTVKVYTLKGYGFLEREDGGKDVFVHHTAVEDGVTLAAGDHVEFEIVPSPRGPRADNVKLLAD
jgi:cold shock protein